MESLTPKQKKIYDSIVIYQNKIGYSPTTEELANINGIKSVSSIYQTLKILENKQYIVKSKLKHRNINLIEENGHNPSKLPTAQHD